MLFGQENSGTFINMSKRFAWQPVTRSSNGNVTSLMLYDSPVYLFVLPNKYAQRCLVKLDGRQFFF